MTQTILTARNGYADLDGWFEQNGIKKPLLVCDASIGFLSGISAKLKELEDKGVSIVRFSDFKPNPEYASVVSGVALFRSERCDAIIAVGGGSAMDVAKCVKLFSPMDSDGADGAFLKAEIVPNGIPFLAMPTTAGTGSEATRYAVIYNEGKKQTVTSYSCIPETVLMDPGVLKTLPLYQKKATMMDALCHAVESFWSVNSTDESKEYAKAAIKGVLDNMEGYLANDEAGNAGMLNAANLAGKAINISQTTAEAKPRPKKEVDPKKLIKALTKTSPVEMRIDNALPEGIDARFSPETKVISVRQGMTGDEIFRALSQEITKARAAVEDKQTDSFAVAAVAYILCKRNDVSPPALPEKSPFENKEPKEIRAALKGIREEANNMSAVINKALEPKSKDAR